MKFTVDFREPEPQGFWLGNENDEIEILCLQYLKSTRAQGKYGNYYINKFRTLDGNIVCINSNDEIPATKEWWTFRGWIRGLSTWDGQRETFVGHPRGINKFIRHNQAKLRALATCPACGLPTQNALPPYCCTCVDVELISQIDWRHFDPFAVEIDPIEDAAGGVDVEVID